MLISIDVGLNGGIAIFKNIDELVFVSKMPTFNKKVGKKNKRKYDIYEFEKIINIYKPKMAVIEAQRAFPGQSAQSVFLLGYGYGVIDGILKTMCDDVSYAEPRVWKHFYDIKKGNKLKSVLMANELYNLDLKKSYDGIAEAILIGRWWYIINT